MTMPQTDAPAAARPARPKLWDGHGRIRIAVEQHHIDTSLKASSSHCAVAEAIKQQIPDATFVSVDLQTIRFSRRNLRFVFLTPGAARNCIINFDQGQRHLLLPFSFAMRPAQISKTGKRRHHTPDDHELQDTGLKVRRKQIHIAEPRPKSSRPAPTLSKWGTWSAASSKQMALKETSRNQLQRELAEAAANTAALQHGEAPQRFTDTGERNMDPNRSDGLATKRTPRAMISTASKGSIPVTLGGKLPKVSILSRREFGLRAVKP